VSIAADENIVAISVSDDGTGVTEGMETRLFERFAHEGESSLLAGSVGLGLSIARTLAHGMDGDIVYEPERGWTTFTLTLPKAPQGAVVELPAGRDPYSTDPAGASEVEVLHLGERRSTAPQTPHRIGFDHG
jgi:hypothetical protein